MNTSSSTSQNAATMSPAHALAAVAAGEVSPRLAATKTAMNQGIGAAQGAQGIAAGKPAGSLQISGSWSVSGQHPAKMANKRVGSLVGSLVGKKNDSRDFSCLTGRDDSHKSVRPSGRRSPGKPL
jgi:hypothetical protein